MAGGFKRLLQNKYGPLDFLLSVFYTLKKKIMPFSAYFRTKQVQTLNLDEAKNILFDSPESGKPE